jgi:hypothetical protein
MPPFGSGGSAEEVAPDHSGPRMREHPPTHRKRRAATQTLRNGNAKLTPAGAGYFTRRRDVRRFPLTGRGVAFPRT